MDDLKKLDANDAPFSSIIVYVQEKHGLDDDGFAELVNATGEVVGKWRSVYSVPGKDSRRRMIVTLLEKETRDDEG